jgi:hypothetical protein
MKGAVGTAYGTGAVCGVEAAWPSAALQYRLLCSYGDGRRDGDGDGGETEARRRRGGRRDETETRRDGDEPETKADYIPAD